MIFNQLVRFGSTGKELNSLHNYTLLDWILLRLLRLSQSYTILYIVLYIYNMNPIHITKYIIKVLFITISHFIKIFIPIWCHFPPLNQCHPDQLHLFSLPWHLIPHQIKNLSPTYSSHFSCFSSMTSFPSEANLRDHLQRIQFYYQQAVLAKYQG